MKLFTLFIIICTVLPACATRRYVLTCRAGDKIIVDRILDKEPIYDGPWVQYQNEHYAEVRTNAPCVVSTSINGQIAPWDKYQSTSN